MRFEIFALNFISSSFCWAVVAIWNKSKAPDTSLKRLQSSVDWAISYSVLRANRYTGIRLLLRASSIRSWSQLRLVERLWDLISVWNMSIINSRDSTRNWFKILECSRIDRVELKKVGALAFFELERIRNNVTHLGVKQGAYLRSFVYTFIELFSPTLTKKIVEQAMSSESESYEI